MGPRKEMMKKHKQTKVHHVLGSQLELKRVDKNNKIIKIFSEVFFIEKNGAQYVHFLQTVL